MRTRQVVGWVTTVVAVVTSIPILGDAWSNYQKWRTTTNDPSAKDAYLTFLEIDIVLLIVLVVIAGAGVLIARGVHRTKKTI